MRTSVYGYLYMHAQITPAIAVTIHVAHIVDSYRWPHKPLCVNVLPKHPLLCFIHAALHCSLTDHGAFRMLRHSAHVHVGWIGHSEILHLTVRRIRITARGLGLHLTVRDESFQNKQHCCQVLPPARGSMDEEEQSPTAGAPTSAD